MKKVLLAIIALASMTLSASAQETEGRKGYFGLRLGTEMLIPGNVAEGKVSVDMFGVGAGGELGAIYNAPIGDKFYFEPGLKFYYGSYPFNGDFYEHDVDDVSIIKAGMRVPLNMGMSLPIENGNRVHIFTGPELEYGFSAKARARGDNFSVSESVYGEGGGMRRFNVLWSVGAGLKIKKIYLGLSASFGLLNLMDDDDFSFREHRIDLSIGYDF